MYKYIAVLTDFGLKDPYVGVMKSVILNINPNVRIIDISHEIPSFSIKAAAYVLLAAKEYFPRNTIFLVVVDPGVGSRRRAIVIKTKKYVFVGPDNGVLYPVVSDDGIVEIRSIDNENLLLKPVSHTFHGRDVFAPIAALLSKGIALDVIGNNVEADNIVKLDLELIRLEEVDKGKTFCGEVIYIDKFGNIVLNIRASNYNTLPIGKLVEIKISNKVLKAYSAKTFSSVKPGDLALYINSFRFLELGVNMGDAAKRLNAHIGDRICLTVKDV